MTIQEAIELLTEEIGFEHSAGPSPVATAHKMAVQALYRLQRLRSDKHCPSSKLLAAETPPGEET